MNALLKDFSLLRYLKRSLPIKFMFRFRPISKKVIRIYISHTLLRYMTIRFISKKTEEDYQYTIGDGIIDGSDVVITFSYRESNVYKTNYFTFLINEFIKFHSKWIEVSEKGFINLKNVSDKNDKINPVRLIVHDVYKNFTDEFQLVEFLTLEKNEESYILKYRFLGQLVERRIMEAIVNLYLEKGHPSIKEVHEWLGDMEEKEAKLRFKNKMDFSNDLVKFDEDSQSIKFDEFAGMKKLLAFEENIYTSDDFSFRRYPEETINNICEIVFSGEDIEKMRHVMEEVLLQLSTED